MATSERILVITDLLMGAAHADHTRSPEEEAKVRGLVGELLGAAELPAEVSSRMKSFDPAKLDVAAAAKALAGDSEAQKHNLLELVAAVRDADGEVDLDEDAYLRKVAKALGVAEADIADLVLDIEIEDLKDNVKSLTQA
jgi:uncharacterized tellurite resistance protein B-like protein